MNMIGFNKSLIINDNNRKLIILDLNGFLIHRIDDANITECPSYTKIPNSRFWVKLRPYAKEFLRWCFDNFEVVIWSTVKSENILPLINILLGDDSSLLAGLYCNDHCTRTGIFPFKKKNKEMLLKDLSIVWKDFNGKYGEHNTLLIDDSTYKTYLNPKNTAIFPPEYNGDDSIDTLMLSVNPVGPLVKCLQEILLVSDIREYVSSFSLWSSEISIEYTEMLNKAFSLGVNK